MSDENGGGSTLDSVFGAVGRFGENILDATGDAIAEGVRGRYTRKPDDSVNDRGAQAVGVHSGTAGGAQLPATAPGGGLADQLAGHVPLFVAFAVGVLIVGLLLKKLG